MKQVKIVLLSSFLMAFFFSPIAAGAQNKKLPDGSIVYPDGSRKLPNGTVINKSGTVIRTNTNVILPGGQVVRRERTHPRKRRHTRYNRGQGMPPGQAKKIYGGKATDYAPGQRKKKKRHD